MANGDEGWRILRPGRGAPLVLAFGTAADPAVGLPPIFDDPGAPEHGRIDLGDSRRSGYYRGVAGLGGSIAATADALKSIIDGLGPSRLITLGEGVGGHAALVFGILLRADRIVAVQPAAHLIAGVLEQYADRRWPGTLAEMPDPAEAERFDAYALLGRHSFDGHAHILLGTRRTTDGADAVHQNAIHAQWLARSDRVRLHRFPEIADLTLDWLATDPEGRDLLSRHLFGDERAIEPAPSPARTTTATGPADPKLVYDPKLTLCSIGRDDPINKTGRAIAYGAAGDVDPTLTRRIDDGWRRWIVENLLLDASPEDLATTLLPFGISRRETLMEIDLARFHPYFSGFGRVQARLAKRDWLLAAYRKLDRMGRRRARIERRERIARKAFFKDFSSTGRPLILAPVGPTRTLPPEEVGSGWGGRPLPAPEGEPAELWTMLGDDEARDRDDLRGWDGVEPSIPDFLDDRDHSGGSLWVGRPGSRGPQVIAPGGLLVLPIRGRVAASLAPLWDRALLPEAPDSTLIAERPPADPASRTPLDLPKVLAATVESGESLFVPAGCWYELVSRGATLVKVFELSA